MNDDFTNQFPDLFDQIELPGEPDPPPGEPEAEPTPEQKAGKRAYRRQVHLPLEIRFSVQIGDEIPIETRTRHAFERIRRLVLELNKADPGIKARIQVPESLR